MIYPVIIPIQQSSDALTWEVWVSGFVAIVCLCITIGVTNVLNINTWKFGTWASLSIMVVHIGLSLVFGTVTFVLFGVLWSLLSLLMDRC